MKKYIVKRIYTENTLVRGKKYLSEEEERLLFDGEVIVEEKLDGKQTFIEIGDYIVFGEDLRQTHTILYIGLPAPVIYFDVYDKVNKRFLGFDEKIKFLIENGLTPPPLIYRGVIKYGEHRERLEDFVFNTRSVFRTEINPLMREKAKLIPEIGDFVDKKNFIEGIVVKNYRHQVFGKVVNPKFELIIDHLGRYENYPYKNVIIPFTTDEYKQYLSSHLSRRLKWEH